MRTVLIRAAKLLEREARCISNGHTLRGVWAEKLDEVELAAKRDHDELRATAAGLRELAREIYGMPTHTTKGGPG